MESKCSPTHHSIMILFSHLSHPRLYSFIAGKTVELIALILGNPRLGVEEQAKARIQQINNSRDALKACEIPVPSRATLIVVPTTLIGQWGREMLSRVVCSDMTGPTRFDTVNLSGVHCVNSQRMVRLPISKMDLVIEEGVDVKLYDTVSFTLPWGTPNKVRKLIFTPSKHYVIILLQLEANSRICSKTIILSNARRSIKASSQHIK